MKRGKLGATECAIVQRRSQQHAGCAGVSQRSQIGGMAHATGRIQAAVRPHCLQLRQPRHIRPETGANPRQGHHDDPRRPGCGHLQQAGRPNELIAAKIQRNNAVATPCVGFRHGRQALAAQHRPAQPAGLPVLRGREIGEACIDPQFQLGVAAAQTLQRRPMIAALQNCIQIGDIQPLERIATQQSIQYRLRPAGTAQYRLQRAVLVAPTGSGAYHLPAHQVEYWNQV